MKFQIGDKVLILHSNEEGEVIDIINKKMVMVEVRGVKFPAYVDQLDFPYFKKFSEKTLFPKKREKKYIDDVKKEKEPAQRINDGVWLAFLPVTETDEFGVEVVDELKIHLVNRTDTGYKFVYELKYFGEPDFELKNELLPFQDFYLHDIPFENLNDSPTFDFEFTLMQPHENKADYYESSLRLKPKQLFSRIEEIRTKGEATFSHRLFESYPDKELEVRVEAEVRRSKAYNASKAKDHLEPPRSVVDLHIEKITNDWSGLSNHEIISLQLKTFEKYFDLAVAHMQPSLVVVHGVGTGRLREEIHEQLKHRKEVKTFVNQYHPAFGYGATEIFFQY
ncbi:MAG TPA: Smr/MutS family protein [Chitinophagaceae bacterium]|nr:Smr/MutS family protein [Chitinophagaceae bacterium]